MNACLVVAQAVPETGLRIDWTTMPVYNTVMAVAAGAGLIMLVLFARELLRSPSDVIPESWALAFGAVGVILTATGLHMTLTWPLAVSFPFDNIIFGEPSLAFGVLLSAAALSCSSYSARSTSSRTSDSSSIRCEGGTMNHTDRVALVTGAGSGIGRAIAHGLAAAGARVVVSDLDEAGGAETVAAIERSGGTAIFVRADVARPADGEALVGSAVKEFGALHVAVNNAGIGGPSAPTGEYPVDGWDRVVAINLSGVFYGMRYQIPAMLDAAGGAIVNVASILGQVGFANAPAYVAAKHGVVGLTRTAAVEYSARGIRVNAVGPAFIKTPLIEKNMTPEARAGLVAKHPIGRLGEPEEVAELVVWLTSDRASFMTGSYYAIDGGYLAQ